VDRPCRSFISSWLAELAGHPDNESFALKRLSFSELKDTKAKSNIQAQKTTASSTAERVDTNPCVDNIKEQVMKVKLLIFLVSLSLLLSFGLVKAQVDTSTPDIEELVQILRQKMQELNEQIVQLQTKLATLTQDIEKLEETITFTKNLKRGVIGDDVKNLQELLSKDPDIYPEGLVTGYFGSLTESAIKRFQEKYAKDILQPWGLTKGTGFVGQTTIAKLHELYRAVPAAPAAIIPTVPAESVITPEEVDSITEVVSPSDLDSISVDNITEMVTPLEDGVVPAVPATPAIPAIPPSGSQTGGTTPATPATPAAPDPEPEPEPTPTEDTQALCSDGIDNDGDGLVDLDDPHCSAFIPEGDTTSPIISNIQASSVTESSAILIWTTNEVTSSDVDYGLTSSYGSTAPGVTTGGISHQLTLSGLTSSTTYHYQVSSTDDVGNTAQSSDQTFATTAVKEDTLGPWITDLSILPTEGSPGEVITFTASAQDPSGVKTIVYDITYPPSSSSDGYVLRPNCNFDATTNSSCTLSQTIDYGISPAILGDYTIAIRIVDNAGNLATYYSNGSVENSEDSVHELNIPSIAIQ